MTKRRTFAAEFKAQVVLELLSSTKRPAELGRLSADPLRNCIVDSVSFI